MNAVVSGHSGVALLIDGDTFSSIHFGEDEVRQRRPGDFRLLFNGARDLQFLEGVELEQVRERLDLESTRIDALHLALILLDPELAHDTRRTAAEELEELLTDESITHWLESVLHARPLPRSGDPVGAHSACTGRTERTRAFLGKLESLQPVIAEVHEAWERIPKRSFGTDDDRQHVLSVAVKEGLFRDLVAIRAAREPLSDFVARSLMNPAFGKLANARQALDDWMHGFGDLEEAWTSPPRTVSYVAEASAPTYWNNSQPHPTDTPEELFQRYYRPVVFFFRRRGFSSEESRDLAQETFLRVSKRWDSFRGESAVETWLFQIASNLYKNTLRSQATQKRETQDVSLEHALSEEGARILRAAIADLPPQMRQAVCLRVEGDLKYREIADIMHISIETVKAHLHQARQHLRDKLAERFLESKL